ncbi:hypothetical protein COY06_00430 [Candidatus Peregrinibacteria bacterium CG_4_10_14_0_2_um_filter_41_8]|nr:MAG: hypothetical protein COY06_00430 [Candidatus Peregrinibacteria bacterium CG_4_10_14_0_2_um_filter_41_8]
MPDRLNQLKTRFRQELLELYSQVKWGDLPSMFSCLDILIGLYFGQDNDLPLFKHHPLEPSWSERDYFILSKTQALLAHYFILAKRGYFEESELTKTHYFNPTLPYHPSIKTKGVNSAARIAGTGSAIAAGIAFQLHQTEQKNHVFCLCGDSEIQQGLFWESLMLIQHHQIKNFTLLIDYNELQMNSQLRASINYLPLGEKLGKFGFRVIPVANGHNLSEIVAAITKAKESTGPCALIFHTTKGKGISFFENRTSYSYQQFSPTELTTAQNELS